MALEDAGRDYYEQQFGSRINDVVKPGAESKPASSGPRRTGAGAGGAVVVFLILLVLRLLVGAGTSRHYDPPPRIDMPRFEPPPRFQMNPAPDLELQERLRALRMREDLRRFADPD